MTEFTDSHNFDPAQQERLARWDAINREINRSSTALYGHGLDEGINDAVVGVNAVLGGFYTRMSCEGHDDQGSRPYIGFNLAGNYDDDPARQAQLDGLMDLIDEFNDQRTTDPRVRLGVYDGLPGYSRGAFEISTPTAIELRDSGKFSLDSKSHEEIEAEQQEFADFAAFVKEKFINGFSIEAPAAEETAEEPMDEEYELDRDQEQARLYSLRAEILEDFAERPGENDVWEAAYDMVRNEGDFVEPDDEPLTTDDIPADELIAFAEKVRNTPAGERYDLMAETAPNGQPWFDVLDTFSSSQVERAKLLVLENMSRHFGTALDVGTGSGKSLHTLEAVADKVIGLDSNEALLRVAEQKKEPTTELLRAGVESLPFQAQTFDMVASSGLEHALNLESATQFYQELARVLAPDGVYVDGSYYPSEDGYEGREMDAIKWSSKAMLADMIVDTTSGKLLVENRLDAEAKAQLFEQLGLAEQYYVVEDPMYADGTESLVRIITKR